MTKHVPEVRKRGSQPTKSTGAEAQSSDTLHQVFGRRGWLVPIGLFLVLASNIIALFLPFLEISGLKPGVYSLPHTITLLWSAGLILICLLIILFSIVFPLFKNVSLIFLWFAPMDPKKRLHAIHTFESLGKWSMLDIYVMILILVLTSDQLFIGAKPMIGMLCFVLAIIGNMIMARIIAVMDGRIHRTKVKADELEEKFSPLVRAGWIGLPIPILLIASMLAVAVTFIAPLVRIDKMFLYSHRYTLWTATEELFKNWHWGLGIFMILFLLIMPLLSLALMLYLYLARQTIQASTRVLVLYRMANHWTMLNVFLLALGLFLVDGGEMVKLDIKMGVWLLIATVLWMLFSTVFTRIIMRHIGITLSNNEAS